MRNLVLVLTTVALTFVGCGSGTPTPTPSPSPTETPSPTPSATLTVTPTTAALGAVFTFDASGLQPGEIVKFTITLPTQKSFVGPAHTTGADGHVVAKYAPATAGSYSVVGNGDKGSTAQATFTVTARTTPARTPVAIHQTTPVPTIHSAKPTATTTGY